MADIVHLIPLQDSPFSESALQAKALLVCLRDIAEKLSQGPELSNNLGELVEGYTKSGDHRLELLLAKARRSAVRLGTLNIGKGLQGVLEHLASKIRERLDTYDQHLERLVREDWGTYTQSPRLSVRLLPETVINRMLELPADRCVWVLIFDGMRLDAWDEVVKPELAKHFTIKGERLCFCPLPSFTRIARRSLLAGALPGKWQGYDGSFTNDERILAGKLFGLPKSELESKMNLSDEDKKAPQLTLDLDSERKRVNVLIYRLSDKWIHTFEDDLCELNEALRRKLKNILPSLLSHIKPGDLALVASDHGFIELSEKGRVDVLQSGEGSKIAKESVFSLFNRHSSRSRCPCAV